MKFQGQFPGPLTSAIGYASSEARALTVISTCPEVPQLIGTGPSAWSVRNEGNEAMKGCWET